MIIKPHFLHSPSLASLPFVVAKKLENISQTMNPREYLNSGDLSVIPGAFYAHIYQTQKHNL
jgi:hypothetical protein